MHKTTRWIPFYLAIVLFSLTTFRQMPSLLRYSRGTDLVHMMLTNPLSYSHTAPEVISQIGIQPEHQYLSSSHDGLWQNEYNAVHVVHTRFMQHQASLLHLAAGRLQLFRTFTLPSMMQQSSKQFLWIIWIDPHLDGPVYERLVSLVARLPNALIIAANDHGTRTTADLRSLYNIPPSDVKSFVREGSSQLLLDYYHASQSRLLVETRVDADDAVHRLFVESVQQHAAKAIGQEAENEHAIQVLCPEHHVEWHYYKRDDEDNPLGHLTHYHNQEICINSGLSVAYHIHATHKQLEFMDSNQYNNVQQKIPICGDDAQEMTGTATSSSSSLRGGVKAQDQEAKMATRHTTMIRELFEQHQQQAQAAIDDEQRAELAEQQKDEATALSQQIDAEKTELQQRLQKRHPHYAHARDSNECWTTLEMMGDHALHVNSFQAAIVLARTPLAAGMNNVLPKKFTSRHSVELPTYESTSDQIRAWELMAQDFHLFQLAVQQTRATLESDMRNIVMDALAGQCTTGHSCKPASKKALLSIVYMIELKEKDSGVLDELDDEEEEKTEPETIMDKLIALLGLHRPDPDLVDDETAAVIDLLPADAPEYDIEKIMGNQSLDSQIDLEPATPTEPQHAQKTDANTEIVEEQESSMSNVNQSTTSDPSPILDGASLTLSRNDTRTDTTKDVQSSDRPEISPKNESPLSEETPIDEPVVSSSQNDMLVDIQSDKGKSLSKKYAPEVTMEEETPSSKSQIPPLYARLWSQVFGRNSGEAINKSNTQTNHTSLRGDDELKGNKAESNSTQAMENVDDAKPNSSSTVKTSSGNKRGDKSSDPSKQMDSQKEKTQPQTPTKQSPTKAFSSQKKEPAKPAKEATPATKKTNTEQNPKDKAKPTTKPKPKPKKKKTKVLYEGVEREYMIPKHVENIRDMADTHYEVELYVKPDEHPEHASFKLYDLRAERVVAERKHLSGEERIYVVPIPTGHYSFEFQDSEGDGFTGKTTRFELWVNKKKLVEGSDFGSSSGKREFKLYTNGHQKLVNQSEEKNKNEQYNN